MESISAINLMPSNSKELQAMTEDAINYTLSGEANVLKMESQVVFLEKFCKNYRANQEIKEAVLGAAENEGSMTFDAYGCQIQIKEVGVKYNYSELGHRRYDEVCAAIEKLNEEKKELENLLKAHSKAWVETDMNTGETYEVMPAVKSSTTQAVFTIKK